MQYEDMKRIVKENVCSECGAELQIRTNPEKGPGVLEVGCPIVRSHVGYTERETYTQAYRRGDLVPSFIEDKIKKRMLPEKADLDRTINLVATRYPRADLDHPSTALFILDCWRMDLDPLIGEIIPVTFKGKDNKIVVAPIITEDGYLSLAARGCPDKWAGAPNTVRIEDYLAKQEEHRGKTSDEINALAKDIKRDMCKDEGAYLWVAIGKVKIDGEIIETEPTYGWYKKRELEKQMARPEERRTPAAELPGNQARVRAIKRWVRENFPESRHNMMQLTAEWMSRAEGVKEAQEVIDAEYRILATPTAEDEHHGERRGERLAEEELFPIVEEPPPPENEFEQPIERDVSQIKTRADFYKACQEDFPKLSKEQALERTGFSSEMAVVDWAEAYMNVVGLMGRSVVMPMAEK